MKNLHTFESFLNKVLSSKSDVNEESSFESLLGESTVNEDFDKSLHKKILKFIESTKTYMDVYDKDDTEEIVLTTRENGNVGYEIVGDEDIAEAKRVQKLIKNKFPDLRVSIEEVDEWVYLNILGPKVAEYRYIFQKADPETGSGFSETFDTFDEMLKKRKTFVDGVNWKDVKKELDKITDYPEDLFTGWHSSNKIVISKAGDKGNNWGYDFYVYKLRGEK